MATPFVPVAVPAVQGLPGGGGRPRPQRTPSLGSASNSSGSSSSRGEGAGPRDGEGGQCPSPVTRARLHGAECGVEYSSCPRHHGDGCHGDDDEEDDLTTCGGEDRPLTPTVLGYEVMEERAKFTVSGALHPNLHCCRCYRRFGTAKWRCLLSSRLGAVDLRFVLPARLATLRCAVCSSLSLGTFTPCSKIAPFLLFSSLALLSAR